MAELILTHGSDDAPLATTPMFGHAVKTPKVAFSMAPSAAYDVSFTADRDLITIFHAAHRAELAFDTDRLSEATVLPYRFHFTPFGSTTYSRTSDPMGGLIEIAYAPELRRSLDDDFGQGVASAIVRIQLNVPVPRAAGLGRMALRLLLSRYKPDSLIIESLGLTILSELVRTILKQEGKPLGALELGLCRLRLMRTLELIDAELEQDISLHRLSDAAGLSVFHFAKAFKIAMGMPPRQYVIERRMSRARDLLAATCLSLAEIAYAVGFSSQSHMTAAFSARLGITPAGYREALTA